MKVELQKNLEKSPSCMWQINMVDFTYYKLTHNIIRKTRGTSNEFFNLFALKHIFLAIFFHHFKSGKVRCLASKGSGI